MRVISLWKYPIAGEGFCTTSTPHPTASVSSVRLPHRYTTVRYILEEISYPTKHTCTLHAVTLRYCFMSTLAPCGTRYWDPLETRKGYPNPSPNAMVDKCLVSGHHYMGWFWSGSTKFPPALACTSAQINACGADLNCPNERFA